MKRLLLVGVMTLGLGFTSALAAPQEVGVDLDADANPERVTESVVLMKKDVEKDYPFLNKPKEVKSYDELLRELDEIKKREDQRRIKEIEQLRAEQERQRLAEEQRQRELAKKRSQQLAKVKAEEERKAKAQATSVKATLNIEFSYYIAMCDSGCSGRTATGIDVRNTVYYQGMRIVATDPNVIPTWSIIQFEMDGQMVKAIALDTGGYIKGHKIDMLVGSTNEAWKRGRGIKKVEILRYGK
jgi:3D (Asp-Asp-Asp) domain-containing protein